MEELLIQHMGLHKRTQSHEVDANVESSYAVFHGRAALWPRRSPPMPLSSPTRRRFLGEIRITEQGEVLS